MQRRRLILCLLIVAVNSGPGLYLSWPNFDRAGILLGVAVWAAIFVGFGLSPVGAQVLGRVYVRRAIYVALALRAIPYCWFVDLFAGILSITAFGSDVVLLGDVEDFARTLGITLFHGLLMCLIFLAAVSILSLLFGLGVKKHPDGVCRKCGYDLRASPVRCPECGTPNPKPGLAPLADIET